MLSEKTFEVDGIVEGCWGEVIVNVQRIFILSEEDNDEDLFKSLIASSGLTTS